MVGGARWERQPKTSKSPAGQVFAATNGQQGPLSGSYRKAFFHSRSAANASTASASGRPACACAAANTAGSAARRNGLVASSSSMRRRHGRQAAIALGLLARLPLDQRRVARLDRAREAQVRERVLVPAVDTRIARQRRELRQRRDHICAGVPSNSRPQPQANSVSPQNVTAMPVRSCRRRRCAPPYGPERRAPTARGPCRRNANLSSSATACVRPGIVSRAGPKTGTSNCSSSAAMPPTWSPVVMRDRDRGEREPFALEVRQHRRRVAGVDDRRARDLPHEPDVVVAERGDGDNRRHGRIFRSSRTACQRRSPIGSRRRSAATCSRASRRTSTGPSPTSSASTRSRSGCRAARFSRRAGSRRAGPSTTSRPPRSSPTRTGCRSPRTRSTSSCCRTRSSSPSDPHQLLREVYRVMRPEGQIVIAGFNPFSLFGAKRYFGRGADAAVERQLHRALPAQGLARAARLRRDRRPPRLLRAAVREREMAARASASSKRAGDRWWPIAGGVYYLRATKKRARHARHHAGVGTRATNGARDRAAAGAREHRARRPALSGARAE